MKKRIMGIVAIEVNGTEGGRSQPAEPQTMQCNDGKLKNRIGNNMAAAIAICSYSPTSNSPGKVPPNRHCYDWYFKHKVVSGRTRHKGQQKRSRPS